ncbi:MAG: rod shape-determining protein MreD [Parasphingorhabdus sp.]|jgi:rod shape-determining protein MreD
MLLGNNNYRPVWIVVTSIICAVGLNIFPLGWMWGYFQPDWVALVVIYWCFWEPERRGAGLGWISGLLMDVVDYAVLGKNMLSKTVCAFFANKISLRLRVYPVWQQCIGVAVLVTIDTAVIALVQHFLGQSPLSTSRWLAPLSSMLMWPVVVFILNGTARRRGYMR